MDQHPDLSDPDQATEAGLAQHLVSHCAQAEAFLGSHRLRIEVIEAELLEELSQLSSQIAEAAETGQQTAELATARQELQQRSAALDQLEDQLRSTQQTLEQRLAELDDLARTLDQRQAKLDADAQRLGHEDEQLEKEKAATRRQRRRIANELKAKRAELLDELANQRAALAQQQSQLDAGNAAAAAIAELTAQRDALQQQHDQLHEQLQRLQAGLDEAATQSVAASEESLRQIAQQRDTLEQERDALAQQLGAIEKGFSDLQDERDQLRAALDAAANPPDASLADAGGDHQFQLEELARRLDLAIEDVKDLNRRNAELQQQLDAARAEPTCVADATVESFDWERQKLRLMAALDGSGDGPASVDKAERLSIEETIRKTDAVVAAQQREIESLRAQVDTRPLDTRPPDEPDQPREDVDQLLDGDELVQQERLKLIALQEALREKQRVAEVEISLERAKLARERSQIEDRMAELERDKRQLEEAAERVGEQRSVPGTQKPISRWKKRLGLTDNGE